MNARTGIAVAALLAFVGIAAGQVSTVVVNTEDTETEGARPTDANVGVDADDAVLVITNMQLSLFDKSGVQQANEQVGDSTFLIVKALGPMAACSIRGPITTRSTIASGTSTAKTTHGHRRSPIPRPTSISGCPSRA